jgi:hypothetical protein
MEKRLGLHSYGTQLWAKDKARQIRALVEDNLEKLEAGGVVVVDAEGVEVFDFSFAGELFCKTLLRLANEYAGRFMVVENLNECTGENLGKALESSNLAMIERVEGSPRLIGRVHPTDQETFGAIVGSGGAVSAASLSRKLEVNLTAMNERLSKLTSLGVVRRERSSSARGREQYAYRVLS